MARREKRLFVFASRPTQTQNVKSTLLWLRHTKTRTISIQFVVFCIILLFQDYRIPRIEKRNMILCASVCTCILGYFGPWNAGKFAFWICVVFFEGSIGHCLTDHGGWGNPKPMESWLDIVITNLHNRWNDVIEDCNSLLLLNFGHRDSENRFKTC